MSPRTKILKTLVQLILNSTRPHVITYTNSVFFPAQLLIGILFHNELWTLQGTASSVSSM